MANRPKVVIVGAGLAGLSAAKYLLDAGFAVEILEKRPILGGKVSAWKDRDGDWVESGLHVFFGAYQDIFVLMKELGIYKHILWKEHVLTYTLDKGERFEFRTIPAPSPLHLLPAVFCNHYFNLAEKLTLAKSLGPILFGDENYYAAQDQLSYQEWHRRQGIADRLLKKMFLPMTLALKFLSPADISARIVLDVSGLFLRKNDASRMGFLPGSPQEYLIQPLADNIRSRGGVIRSQVKISQIIQEPEGAITALETSTGEWISGDYFVLALPIHNLKKLMPPAWRRESFFDNLFQFEGVPVITVQLWLDRQVSGIDNVLFCPDGAIPVYADMGNTTPDYANGGRSRFEFVVAPARDLMGLTDAEIVARVWQDVQRVFPHSASGAEILKSTVVRIPQSVYWPKPGLDHLRPTQNTPIPNLFLAGGYTLQRFYDSMEGAVASGKLAAKALVVASENLETARQPIGSVAFDRI